MIRKSSILFNSPRIKYWIAESNHGIKRFRLHKPRGLWYIIQTVYYCA